MKRINKYKKLISFLAVLIVLTSIACIPAHATWNPTSKNRFGAWLGSALLALNITLNSTIAPIEQMYEYIADPVAEQIEYTFPATDWEDDIMNRAVIKITPDIVTIDGVDYTDIWISNSAAEKFRVNAFDFKTGYSIASNTGATFASGYGTIDGAPTYIFDTNKARTQGYIINNVNGTYPFYNGQYVVGNASAGNKSLAYKNSDNKTYSRVMDPVGGFPNTNWLQIDNIQSGGVKWYTEIPNGQVLSTSTTLNSSKIIHDPFDFDYVATTIPADSPLPSDVGMSIRVPSDSPGLQNFITNNIDFTVNTGKEIDFNLDPDIKGTLDDLIDIIAPILVNVSDDDVTFNTMPETPAPVVDNLLPDTYKSEIINPIINEITNQQTILEELPDQITGPIVEAIPTINQICENIDTAPYHDLDTGLDHLPTVFLPFITDLRSALGIWHYVTEWISQISTTFAFVTGCLVGTSIMTPIYAAIAGFMCIKVYRRMTG